MLDGSAKQRLRDALPLQTPEVNDEEPPMKEPTSSPSKRKAVEQSAEDVKRNGKQRKLSFGAK